MNKSKNEHLEPSKKQEDFNISEPRIGYAQLYNDDVAKAYKRWKADILKSEENLRHHIFPLL